MERGSVDWDSFRSGLLSWYDPDRRPLPWKGIGDPYRIWLSEILLQQTRVAQGLPYYERFVVTYPDVGALAAAEDDEVMRLWEGLGYYSRARNLLRAARQVVAEHGGIFPDTYAGLRALPGVGPYTAAAVASLAFGRRVAVVDGNVYRVLARYANDPTPIDGSGARPHYQALAESALGKQASPARFNQAIMDFGATVCTPRRADCPNCPVAARCRALAAGQVYELPVKGKRLRRRERYFHYLVVQDNEGSYLLQRRGSGDVWRGLYEFPLVETEGGGLSFGQLTRHGSWPEWLPTSVLTHRHSTRVHRHQLTHQTIHTVFHEVDVPSFADRPSRFQVVSPDALRNYALPRVITRYLEAPRDLRLDL